MADQGIWDLEQVIRENPVSGESIRWVFLAQGPNSTLNVVQSPIGIKPHIHREHDEIVYILKGEGTFRLGDRTFPYKAGQVVFAPAGTVHGPISDNYVAALSVYSPTFDPDNPDREFVDS